MDSQKSSITRFAIAFLFLILAVASYIGYYSYQTYENKKLLYSGEPEKIEVALNYFYDHITSQNTKYDVILTDFVKTKQYKGMIKSLRERYSDPQYLYKHKLVDWLQIVKTDGLLKDLINDDYNLAIYLSSPYINQENFNAYMKQTLLPILFKPRQSTLTKDFRTKKDETESEDVPMAKKSLLKLHSFKPELLRNYAIQDIENYDQLYMPYIYLADSLFVATFQAKVMNSLTKHDDELAGYITYSDELVNRFNKLYLERNQKKSSEKSEVSKFFKELGQFRVQVQAKYEKVQNELKTKQAKEIDKTAQNTEETDDLENQLHVLGENPYSSKLYNFDKRDDDFFDPDTIEVQIKDKMLVLNDVYKMDTSLSTLLEVLSIEKDDKSNKVFFEAIGSYNESISQKALDIVKQRFGSKAITKLFEYLRVKESYNISEINKFVEFCSSFQLEGYQQIINELKKGLGESKNPENIPWVLQVISYYSLENCIFSLSDIEVLEDYGKSDMMAQIVKYSPSYEVEIVHLGKLALKTLEQLRSNSLTIEK